MTAEWISVSTPYLTPRENGEPDPWTAETEQHGHRGAQKLVEVSTVQPPTRVAEALHVPDGMKAVRRRRLMLVDDEPVEITDSYYPLWLAEGTALAEPRKIRGGAVTLLAELGHRTQRVLEEVEARLPTAEERELLTLADACPVLVLHRAVQADRPVEFSSMTMVARNRRLRYELTV